MAHVIVCSYLPSTAQLHTRLLLNPSRLYHALPIASSVAPRWVSVNHNTRQTVYPYFTYKLSSTKFFVSFNFQGASRSFKVGENIIRVSNSLDPDETPSLIRIQAVCIYGTMIAIDRIRVNVNYLPATMLRMRKLSSALFYTLSVPN